MTYRRNIQRAELRAGIVAAGAIAVSAQPMGASQLQQIASFNIIRIMRTIFACIEGWGGLRVARFYRPGTPTPPRTARHSKPLIYRSKKHAASER